MPETHHPLRPTLPHNSGDNPTELDAATEPPSFNKSTQPLSKAKSALTNKKSAQAKKKSAHTTKKSTPSSQTTHPKKSPSSSQTTHFADDLSLSLSLSHMKIPQGAVVERFTKNELFITAKSSMRYDDVIASLLVSSDDGDRDGCNFTDSEALQLQQAEGRQPHVIQTFRRCLSIHDDKIYDLEHFSLITFVVPWASDGIVHKDPYDSRKSNNTNRLSDTYTLANTSGNNKLYRSWSITDLRDRFATLRVYGDESDMKKLEQWKSNSLWGLRSIRMHHTDPGMEKVFYVLSSAHVVQVGPIFNIQQCLGVSVDGRACRRPIDPSYHKKYCDACSTRVVRNEERQKIEMEKLMKKKESRRGALDPFAAELKENLRKRREEEEKEEKEKEKQKSIGGKVQCGGGETKVDGLLPSSSDLNDPPSRKIRKTDEVFSSKAQQSPPVGTAESSAHSPHRRRKIRPTKPITPFSNLPADASNGSTTSSSNVENIANKIQCYVKLSEVERPNNAHLLESVISTLEGARPTGKLLASDAIKQTNLLTNLSLAASYNRHTELGIRCEALRRVLKLRRRKYERSEETQGLTGNQSEGPSSDPLMDGVFENLARVARGEKPLAPISCESENRTKSTGINGNSHDAGKNSTKNKLIGNLGGQQSSEGQFGGEVAKGGDLAATIEACLAKKSVIDHLL